MENIKVQKEREIKFEYLRIFSMIIIIMAHYAGHGGVAEINNITVNRLIGSFLEIGGKLGVNLFILISGYFLVNSKFKSKKILKLELQVWFYSVILGFIGICCLQKNISIKDILKIILPVTSGLYWFPTAYIGMYLLTPFINRLINNMDKNNYKALLTILFVTISIVPTFIPIAKGFSNNVFIFVYLIAAYIKKYDITIFKNKNYRNILLSISIFLFIYLSQVICIFLGSKIEMLKLGTSYLRTQNSFFMIMLSIFIFMIFKNMNTKKHSKFILLLSKASFGVYLFHDNPYFKGILWKDILKTEHFYYQNIIVLIIHIIFSVILIYVIGTIIDMIREKMIEKPIMKIEKINAICNKFDSYINFN